MLGAKKKVVGAVKRVGVSQCCDEIKFLSKSFLHQSNFEKLKKCISTIFLFQKRQKEEKIRNVKKSKIEALTFSFSISGFLKPFDISCLCYVG